MALKGLATSKLVKEGLLNKCNKLEKREWFYKWLKSEQNNNQITLVVVYARLEDYVDVFAEPKVATPPISHDHAITLTQTQNPSR